MIQLCKTSICLTLLFSVATSAQSQDQSDAAQPPARASVPPTRVAVSTRSASTLATGTNVRAASSSVPARYSSRFRFQAADSRLTEPVLVVPGKEIPVETAGQIVEDLSVMSRIIEKNALGTVIPADAIALGLFQRGRFGDTGPDVLFSSSGRPRPLYVAGYGVVFFIQVNFPLLGPPEVKEQPPATEQRDAVWAETRRSIYEPRAPTGLDPLGGEAREPYNGERVAALRTALIASMKHATNIRVLEAGEWLTIVVQGTSPQSGASTQGPPPSLAGALAGGMPTGKTVLTLRATKADVDLYAKGELIMAQFEQRVQVVAY